MDASTATAAQEYVRTLIETVAKVVPEPVLGALPANRRGLWTNKALGRLGALPYLIGKAHAKAQAGGLPERFMLVVTPTQVRAFKYTARGRRRDRYEIGEEVAVWKRDAIRVTWEHGGPYATDVTIESPAEGETVLCRVGRGETSEEFLRLMADPTATTAAA